MRTRKAHAKRRRTRRGGFMSSIFGSAPAPAPAPVAVGQATGLVLSTDFASALKNMKTQYDYVVGLNLNPVTDKTPVTPDKMTVGKASLQILQKQVADAIAKYI